MLTRYIPSPPDSSFEVGPLTFHFYALCIIAGIAIAMWLGDKRLRAHDPNLTSVVADVAIFAVPFGIIGGRIYHVMTDWELYFTEGGKGFLGALRIWEGGLGIWGALALGGVGAWIGAKRLGVPFAPFADSIAPGIALLRQSVD